MVRSQIFTAATLSNLMFVNSQWIQNEVPMPFGNYKMSVGHHADIIYLIGGNNQGHTLMEYNITANEYKYNQTFLPDDLAGNTQWWVQLDSILYMMGTATGTTINVFNLQTKHFNCLPYSNSTSDCVSAPAAIDGRQTCLAGSNDYQSLYVISNQNTNHFYILNLFNISWSQGPDMNQRRDKSTCVVSSNDKLYAIGGYDANNNINGRIEYLLTTDIQNNAWNRTEYNLSVPLVRARSVKHDEYIYVIGGFSGSNEDKMHRINVFTDYVELLDDRMAQKARDAAAIIINQTIFVFGGSGATKVLQTYTLPCESDNITCGTALNTSMAPNSTTQNTYTTTISSSYPPTYPSEMPTISPSNSPTMCVDYNQNYGSDDGQKEIVDIFSDAQIIYNQIIYSNDTVIQEYSNRTIHKLHQTIIECNTSICSIDCHEGGSCKNSKIVSIVTEQLYIFCTDEGSCEQLSVSINAENDINVLVLCYQSFSCKDLTMDLLTASDDKLFTNITCFNDYSCDNLKIHTDNSRNVFISFNAYRWSDDIKIYQHYHENVKIQCGVVNDQRYIQYNLRRNIPNEFKVLQLARNEYSSTKRLPCEDIEIICSNNTDFPRSCTYEYDLNVSLLTILVDDSRPNCYWLDIGELYIPTCQGTCGDQVIYYQYQQILRINMIFRDKGNDTNIVGNYSNYLDVFATKSYINCDIHFGTENRSNTSLAIIDAVFSAVLDIVKDTSTIVHGLSESPITFLRKNKKFVQCQIESALNTVAFVTTFTVSSASADETEVNPLFEKDSEFAVQSFKLLREIFGADIEFDEDIHVNESGIAIWIVILIAGFSGCIIIIIIVTMIYHKRHRRRKAEAQTIYMQNPMVISIAIGQYDQIPTKGARDRVGGRFRNLDGIDVDIKNVVNLFEKVFNYQMFPEYDINEYIQQYWTKQQIMNLLTKQAEDLKTNVIIYDSNGKLIKNVDGYDGLIVIISCHGIKDYIISSDYCKIDKSAIHRLFSVDHPMCRGIPRLFVFDCCDGFEERDTDWRAESDESEENASSTEEDEIDDVENDKTIEGGKNVLIVNDADPAANSGDDNCDEEIPDNAETLDVPSFDNETTIKTKTGGWFYGEDNPDHKLAIIHASNQGFQSKMRSDTGSYVIQKLTEKIKSNYNSSDKPNKKFLSQIMDEIQHELHKNGKQLPVSTFNNGTGFIKFQSRIESSQVRNNGEEIGDIDKGAIQMVDVIIEGDFIFSVNF